MTTVDKRRLFLNSLKRGTGEAYIIANENPTIDFSDYIIRGALRNYAYDGQSEPSRAQYIFDLISLSNKKEKIRKAILTGLATEQEDTWSLTHLFDLAKLFALQGDIEARQAIYERFLKRPISHSEWVGSQEILELDGLEGLMYIAEMFGKVIEQNPDVWQDKFIIQHFQDDNPEINIFQELENRSKTNRYIKLYLDSINRTDENRKTQVRVTPVFKDIIDEVLNSKPYLSYKRRKELNEDELYKIAEQLAVEKNKTNIESLLNIFTNHKYPFDSEFILKLAKQKTKSKTRIPEYAIRALRFLKSENIRQFAINNISKAKRSESFIDILISNYENGDYTLLTEIANKFKSDHIIENLAISYIDIYSANKTTECQEPLVILYNKLNCGIHRGGIVKLLIENNVLSDKIRNEIKFDSDLETRQLV